MAIDGQFGGRITFEFAGLRIPPCEGDIIIDPSVTEVSGMANQDGSDAYHQKPKQVGAKVKLRNANGIDWSKIMFLVGNCTITEEDNGRTHLFSRTRLVGKPEVNTATGEVDGLEVRGGVYTQI